MANISEVNIIKHAYMNIKMKISNEINTVFKKLFPSNIFCICA